MSTTTDAVLAQYEKNKNTTSGNKLSSEDRLKKFFHPFLKDGEKSGEARIRILPPKVSGSSPFEALQFHELQINGKWTKIYDPAGEGKRSPLNEVREGLTMQGTEEARELAKQYRSKKFFIVKVIDRDNEGDGVKFWRFKNNYKGDGVLDKIVPLYKNKGDITDPNTGRDLIITLGVTKSNNGKEYTVITSIIPDDSSPLHEDAEIMNGWVADEMAWDDAYAKRPVEYLEIIANGETPRWDNEGKKWTSLEESEETISNNTTQAPESVTAEVVKEEDPQGNVKPEEDLPF